MSDVNKTISIVYKANTKALEASIQKIPRVTDREMKKVPVSLDKNLKKAEHKTVKSSGAIAASLASISGPAAAAGAAILAMGAAALAATGSLFVFGRALADNVNQLVDAQSKTNITTENLKALRLAAEGSGRGFAVIESGLIKFQQSIALAGEGAKKQSAAFSELGIDVNNFEDANSIFEQTIKELGKLEAGTKKNVLAMDLFGKAAGPALIQSGAIDNMQAFVNLTREFGIDTGPEAVATAARFQREFATLGRVTVGQLDLILQSFGAKDGLNSMLRAASSLTVFYGNKAAAAFGGAAKIARGLGLAIIAGNEAMQGMTGTARAAFAQSIKTVQSGMSEISNANAVAMAKMINFNVLMDATLATTTASTNRQGRAARNAGNAAAKAAKEATDALKEQEKANQELEKIMQAGHVARLNEVQKINFEYAKQVQKIKELGETADNQVAEEIALSQAREDRDKKIDEIKLQRKIDYYDSIGVAEKKQLTLEEQVHAARMRMIERQKAARMEISRLVIDNVASSLSTLQSMQTAGFTRERDALEEEINALESKMSKKSEEEMTRKEKIQLQGQKERITLLRSEAKAQEAAANESMKKMHHLNQAASIAQIGMSLAEGIMRAQAFFIGNPILAGIATGVLTTAAGVQVAAVMAQPVPTLHQGGQVGNSDPLAPDEQMIRAKKGEVVLSTAQARQRKQGPEIVVLSPYKHIDRYNRSALRYNTSLGGLRRVNGRR